MNSIYHTITDAEAVVWAKIVAASDDPIETVSNIELIDQALTLQKNKSLLTKKRGLTKQLKSLIAKHCGETNINLSIRG